MSEALPRLEKVWRVREKKTVGKKNGLPEELYYNKKVFRVYNIITLNRIRVIRKYNELNISCQWDSIFVCLKIWVEKLS